jgi:probable rRNA maturation factor
MLKILIQRATRQFSAPTAAQLRVWARQILQAMQITDAELTLRIVSSKEMAALNSTYRHKQGTTNVLSFPFGETGGDEIYLGDIVICAEVVKHEAKAQNKTLDAHWAHMVIHGALHLLGHDHVEDKDAESMEAIEIKTLSTLGFDNPYNTR